MRIKQIRDLLNAAADLEDMLYPHANTANFKLELKKLLKEETEESRNGHDGPLQMAVLRLAKARKAFEDLEL